VINVENRKKLIETALTLDTGREFSQMYEFAATYLRGNKSKGSTDDFFRVVTILEKKPNIRQNASVIGFSGNNYADTIRKWCRYILSIKKFRDLNFDELHFVMCYCARLAKMHKEGC